MANQDFWFHLHQREFGVVDGKAICASPLQVVNHEGGMDPAESAEAYVRLNKALAEQVVERCNQWLEVWGRNLEAGKGEAERRIQNYQAKTLADLRRRVEALESGEDEEEEGEEIAKETE